MRVALEDNWDDIVGKATRGLGKDVGSLAGETGIPGPRIEALLNGTLDSDAIQAVAPALNLDSDTLLAIARNGYHPDVDAPDGLIVFSFAFPVPGYAEMRVNAFVVRARDETAALVFDCGGQPEEIAGGLRENELSAAALFLTHTHQDHVAGIDALKSHTGAPLYAPANELYPEANPVANGDRFDFGRLRVVARETNGHSPGGTTYVVEGGASPIAIVGDALFAGSAGGAPSAWEHALELNRRHILSLPDETILCPGHGPITTVRKEKENNPLFPEYKQR